jgi:hypothetical protein
MREFLMMLLMLALVACGWLAAASEDALGRLGWIAAWAVLLLVAIFVLVGRGAPNDDPA